MKYLISLLILLIFASCDFNPRCIEADEFGAVKIGFDLSGKEVSAKYTSSGYSWMKTSEPIETGYVLDGNEIVAKLDGVWSPWSVDEMKDKYFDGKESSYRVCTMDDFEECDASALNSVADTCFQPKYDSSGNSKICWYAEGIGLYVVFSSSPTEAVAQYFHIADYFETSVSGYQDDWYFVLDPTTIDIDGNNLLDSLSVNDYDDVKVWTRVQNYNFDGNIAGDLAEENLLDSTISVDKLNIKDGDIAKTDAVPTLTFYSGVRLSEPSLTQNTADFVFDNYIYVIKAFFDSFVESQYLRNLINVSLSLLISYFGIAFFLGLMRFSNQEMLLNVIRLGIVMTIINSSEGWDFYNEYFVKFVWDGSQEIATTIMMAVNNAVVDTVSDMEDFVYLTNSQTSAFQIIDDMLEMFLSNDTHTKIWAIGFSHYFGIFIILLIYLALFYFLLALVKFAIQLIFVFFTMIVLLGIGPIMFIFMLFGFTREYFMKWIQNLISVFLQPVLYLMFFGPFAALASFYLYKILYLQVCFTTVCCPPLFNLFGYWFVKSSYDYDAETDQFSLIGYYDPNYMDILMLFLVAALLNYLTDNVSKIANKLSGGFSFAGSLSNIMTDKINSLSISGRNLAGGAALLAVKGTAKIGAVNIANVADRLGLKSAAGMVSGSKQNNFLKAQKNVKNNLRTKGYTDAEISERMKSDPKVQQQMKDDFLRLQHKSHARYNPFGMVSSVIDDGRNKDGKLGAGAPIGILKGLGNRAMASFNLSRAKDYRNKKMSKLERQKQSDRLTGTGRSRELYMAKDKNKAYADDMFKQSSMSKANAAKDNEVYNKDLGKFAERKAKQLKQKFSFKTKDPKEGLKLTDEEKAILAEGNSSSSQNSAFSDVGSPKAPSAPAPSAPPMDSSSMDSSFTDTDSSAPKVNPPSAPPMNRGDLGSDPILRELSEEDHQEELTRSSGNQQNEYDEDDVDEIIINSDGSIERPSSSAPGREETIEKEVEEVEEVEETRYLDKDGKVVRTETIKSKE
ncbi:type IV secretion system protein [Rickettsiales bacterium]|nr:type IV secretion system protein [Rickettsiales bacterium]